MVAVSLKKNFFKQKTAYEITTRLVGSEMCIRDSIYPSAAERVVEPPKPFVLPPVHSDMRRVYALSLIHI